MNQLLLWTPWLKLRYIRAKDKTAVYISHRLSSTKFCDHIAFFTKDGLKEYGTHEELMKLHGEYYEMFEIQGKYYQEGVKVA